mgnify:CR=1 FL=1
MRRQTIDMRRAFCGDAGGRGRMLAGSVHLVDQWIESGAAALSLVALLFRRYSHYGAIAIPALYKKSPTAWDIGELKYPVSAPKGY